MILFLLFLISYCCHHHLCEAFHPWIHNHSITLSKIALISSLSISNPPIDPITSGSQIFTQSCSMCHNHGTNVIAKNRDLRKEAMETYLGNFDIPSIQKFIVDDNVHRGALALSSRSWTDEDYKNVATFVYDQAIHSKW